MKNLEKVIKACQVANPKLQKRMDDWDSFESNLHNLPCAPEEAFGTIPDAPEPTLADVLLAIWHVEAEKIGNGEIFHGLMINSEGWFVRNAPSISSYIRFQKWDLAQPLFEQSEECINFLADLL